MISNNSVINREPGVIGTDDNALYCVTDDVTCCGTPPSPGDGGSGNGQGSWFYPDVGHLLSRTDTVDQWYASWLTGAVLLNFRGNASIGGTGLYHCEIQDATGTTHRLYACIYDNVYTTCKTVVCKISTIEASYMEIKKAISVIVH